MVVFLNRFLLFFKKMFQIEQQICFGSLQLVSNRFKSFQGCCRLLDDVLFFLVVKVFDKLGSATVLVTFGHVVVLRREAFVGPTHGLPAYGPQCTVHWGRKSTNSLSLSLRPARGRLHARIPPATSCC